jgi:MscS family membrane protein
VYHTRDGGIDSERQREAEERVEGWIAAQILPFPDISEDDRNQIKRTLDYPPQGSPDRGGE